MLRRPSLVFIFTVTLTGILNNTLLTPALPNILDEFGRDSDQAGLLVAAGAMAGVVVAPVAGLLADRYGRRLVLVACLAIFGIAGGLAAAAPSFEFLVGARFLQGIGSAGLVNLAVVLIGDHWHGEERTKLIGRNAAVLTIGLAVVPMISGLLTQVFNWRVAFMVYTLALATAAVAWMTLDGHRPTHPPHIREQFSSALGALRSPVLLASIISGFLVFVAIFGLFLTVLPVHLADVFGLEAGTRGLVIALPALTATVASYNLGRLRGMLSPQTVVVVSAALLFVSYTMIGLAGALAVVLAGVVIYGASEGLFIPMLQDINMSSAPDEHRAVVIAAWVGAARLGQTIGPLLAGLALGFMSTGTAFVVGSSIGLVLMVIGWLGPFSPVRASGSDGAKVA